MKYDGRKLISIIVPVHNEALNIKPLHDELTRVLAQFQHGFEIIFVDDGSTDDSVAAIEQLVRQDFRIRLIELARNFGKEPAVTAGLHHARGAAAIVMDADLQHPPELIGEFIAKWEAGADVVVGIKHYGKTESWLKRATSKLFYGLFRMVAQTEITPHASDFRLLDRRVIDAFNQMTERNRLTRGLIDWLGFKRTYVYFEPPARANGEASYTYRKLMALAINTFTSYSMIPLKLAGYVGWAIIILAVPTGIVLYVEGYLFNDPWHLQVSGTGLLALLMLALIGVVLVCLGLVALYIANIHDEVTNRPLYVIRRNEQAGQELTE